MISVSIPCAAKMAKHGPKFVYWPPKLVGPKVSVQHHMKSRFIPVETSEWTLPFSNFFAGQEKIANSRLVCPGWPRPMCLFKSGQLKYLSTQTGHQGRPEFFLRFQIKKRREQFFSLHYFFEKNIDEPFKLNISSLLMAT